MASDLNPLPVPEPNKEDLQMITSNMSEEVAVLKNTNQNVAPEMCPLQITEPKAEDIQEISNSVSDGVTITNENEASDVIPFPDPEPNAEVVQNISSFMCEWVTQLIFWRNWRKSILVFAVLQSIIYDLSSESAISVLNVWAVTGLWITIAYRLYVQFLQWFDKTNIQGNPYQKYLDMDISIPAEQSKALGLLISTKIFGHLDKLRAILLVKSPWESFKWFVFLVGMTLIMRNINFTILFQFVLVFVFTIPKMYEKKSVFLNFPKLRNSDGEVKSIKSIKSEIQGEMDINSSKQSDKVILKKEEGSKTSFESDVTHKPYAGGDNFAISKSDAEACDEFERLADSWTDEETQADT
ncbi:uncharacterized protein LOC108028680 isoform X1 [Drosophila biarmipes]|uniref:uncharacterized protein LOC108028680 isoform X1 n=1 Tax=Drosophila biarmipes TaxID=125945 RepID=UPI0007E6FD42|nr:uncharacterized protein LOC108028680 isoform X1 [Drosophila biarmipes]